MEIIVLGSYGAFPTKDDNCIGYLLKTDNANILIDCGSGVAREIQNYIDLKDLDAVILSHLHNDHYCDMLVFKYAYQVGIVHSGMKPLDVYVPFSPVDKLEMLKGTAFNLHSITEDAILIKDVVISFKKTIHDIETYAMRFEADGQKAGYTADTGYFDGLADFMEGCNVIISECSLLESQRGNNTGHMTPADAVKLAEKTCVKSLIMTHFWYQIPKDEYVNEATNARTKPFWNIIVAERGYVWNHS